MTRKKAIEAAIEAAMTVEVYSDREFFEVAANHPLLSQQTVPEVREFRASWQVSAITANKMLERLRGFFGFCAESGWIEKNPAKALKAATEDHAPTLPFTASELAAISEALDKHVEGKAGERLRWAKRFRALVLVLRWSALRISDAVMLRPEQDVLHVLNLQVSRELQDMYGTWPTPTERGRA